ncbi:hypothetical protein [Fuchsiella alkaliacetigena]|uniref:hypothetical protein n=1 Tax=Fuchsiella alkaliacetigena TaxID=957042 RepID=UPI00200B4F8B|nr:hypothetical protein [Fuchsiella alkaliacetigena]MCK8824319.1 hypothetical protein [Fuchsiella alkaliacetigena]
MQKIEIEVSDYIAELSEGEKDKLVNTFLSISIKERMNKLTDEYNNANNKIKEYEKKYGKTLKEVEEVGIDNESDIDEHEEYMDWVFWQRVYENSKEEIEKYQHFLSEETDG